MDEFHSKFNPTERAHRAQMLQIIYALSTELKSELRHKINFFAHAKKLGWLPKSIRIKKQALPFLVAEATEGFGYKPGTTVKQALAICKREET